MTDAMEETEITLHDVLREMRAGFAKVDDQFTLVKQEFQSVRSDMNEFRSEVSAQFTEVNVRFDRVETKLDATYQQTGENRVEVIDLKNRVSKLEGPSA
jgi:hypothetical protein